MVRIRCKNCKKLKEKDQYKNNNMFKSGKSPNCIECSLEERGYKVKRLSNSFYQDLIMQDQFDLPLDNNCQECGKFAGDGFYPKIFKKGRKNFKKWVCYDCK